MSSQEVPPFQVDRQIWPRRVWLPGALMDVITTRMEKLQSGNLTRFIVELMSFDLREQHLHSITGPFAHEPDAVQQAIDVAIRVDYQRGRKSSRDRVKTLLQGGFQNLEREPGKKALLSKQRHLVYLRRLHADAIRQRMRALRFDHLSQYVTSLIRYDLLLGGQHKYFYGDDCTLEMCLSLDRETLAAFEAHKPRKCMIDYVIEEIIGREMPVEERHAHLRLASERLRDQAVRAFDRRPLLRA